jgi:propionate CoA-transferase
VAAVAQEERISHLLTLTVESGLIGGIPASGGNFGTGVNMDAVIDENQQFDFYDGGGLDMACLGMAECDAAGNVGVSRFGGRLMGAGGFINISQNARLVVFVGTFTGNELKVEVNDGKLRIIEEGRQRKFLKEVEQITFNGQYAYDRGKPVYYVTERCVFRRVRRGLALIEVAPGIEVERDILPYMDFEPIIGEYGEMDARIFNANPMGLEAELLNLSLPERVIYDPERNILFLNFEGMHVRVAEDVKAIWDICELRCRAAGKRVGVIINYDRFRINQDMYDAYAEMDRYFLANYFSQITRYATSAFLRCQAGRGVLRAQHRAACLRTPGGGAGVPGRAQWRRRPEMLGDVLRKGKPAPIGAGQATRRSLEGRVGRFVGRLPDTGDQALRRQVD